MLNQVFAVIFFVLLVSFVFAKQLAFIINRILQANERSTGVRVYNRKTFRDVKTAENFDVWQGVRGFRLVLISLILKV